MSSYTHNKQDKFIWIIAMILIMKSIILLQTVYKIQPGHSTEIIFYICYTTIMSILPVLAISLIFKDSNRALYLLIVDFSVSLLFIADIVYARAFGHFISFYMIFAKGVTNDLGASILSLLRWQDFLVLIDLPFLITFLGAREKIDVMSVTKRKIPRTAIILVSIIISGIHFQEVVRISPEANISLYPMRLSPIGYHFYDFYDFYASKFKADCEIDYKDIQKIDSWFASNSHYQFPSNRYAHMEGILRGKNLIVIQFESLENFVVDYSINGQEITPNLNRIIHNSIFFPNIYEQVRDGNSADAELMFNTSIYPCRAGCTFLRFYDNTYNSLARMLSRRDYQSIAIHGDNKEYWNRDRVFPRLGFVNYISEEDFVDKTTVGMGLSDSALFSQTLIQIKRISNPYYCFIITLTSHTPFNAANDVGTLNLPDKGIETHYLQTINYTDKCLGQFYRRLADEGLLDNTAVIIYGDHEGVHKFYETKDVPENGKRLPFIVHIPEMGTGEVVDTIGGQIDMMPTLAFLLGIPAEEYRYSVMGRNLFGQHSQSVILSDGGTIIGSKEDEGQLIEGLRVADLLLKGDYFSKRPDNQ